MKDREERDCLDKAVALLRRLISIPSFSNEEDDVAELWETWLKGEGVKTVKRYHNNVYALSEKFDPEKPVLLLNSHMDTVKPVASYTRDPFDPCVENGCLYGLGSNDAGASGVALAATFLKLQTQEELPFNLIFSITASEERMGELGMRAFLPHLREEGLYPDMAIVGEPTECKAGIAERGLVVCDAQVKGVAGHAARNEGVNAIYRAIEDIGKIRKLKWDKRSEILGDIKISVTMIDAGTQHNVIPDKCHYVVDIRTTDAYSNEETVKGIRSATEWSDLVPRSTRIRASVLPTDHPLVKAAEAIELQTFVSPTTSDMALMYDIPSIKIGPGKSERSHSADEYVKLDEILQGIKVYENFIKALSKILTKNSNYPERGDTTF